MTLLEQMTRERVVSAAAGAAVTLVLGVLVFASFMYVPSATAAPAVGAVPTLDARALPFARGIARVRDEAPVDLAATLAGTALAELDVLVVGLPVVTPEPTPEPTAEPTPAPTPAPTPRPAPRPTVARTPRPAPVVTTTTAEAEQRMLVLMNASRAAGGLVPLTLDARASVTARAHSQAEAEVRYVYHDGPDGTAKSRNVPACGTGWYGENTGKIWNGLVDVLHIEFMNEPWEPINHRTNIMDPAFRRVGIGAVDGPDALYMTMVFCR